ncbi:hypothetical protein [Cyanobium sp. Copco_Reservoir_LC18]|uniref:hypothetical protein n=1 Tax=Cyanobium sp. Copco_Reservoir_LC18 TaxID=1328305 RepID=UPI00135C20D6|nr:hypothetical protein [Cyanobium sp. Copco_Reservoir_LC18]
MAYPPGVVGRFVSLGVESAELLPGAVQDWAWLLEWSRNHWLWLTWGGVAVAAIVVCRCWSWLLVWPAGRFWPIPAALLPPVLAVSSRFVINRTVAIQVTTASVLLMAIAMLQIYGQAREERRRDLADAEIGRIAAGVDRIGTGVRRVEDGVSRLANALSLLAAQAEEDEEEEI